MSAPAQIQTLTPPSDGTILFYEASSWVQLTLIKQTTGTVLVGTTPNLAPVSAGLGLGVPSGTPLQLTIGPGTQMYCIAGDDNQKLGYMAQPMPAPGEVAASAETTAAQTTAEQTANGVNGTLARVVTPTPRPGTRDARRGPAIRRHADRADGRGRGR